MLKTGDPLDYAVVFGRRKRCCVDNCYSNTAKRPSQIKHLKFFEFPSGEENWTRKERWLNFLNLHYQSLEDSFIICSLHFCDNDFIYIPRKAMTPDMTLKDDAFPHKNLDNRQDVACPVLLPKKVTVEILKDASSGEIEVIDLEVTTNSAPELGVVKVPRPKYYMDAEEKVLPEVVSDQSSAELYVGSLLIPLGMTSKWTEPSEADLKKFRSQKVRFKGIHSYISDSFYVSACRICFRSVLGPCVRFNDPDQAEEVDLVKKNAKLLFPDIQLDFYPDPVVCLKCSSMLSCSAELIATWQETEKKIYQEAKMPHRRLKPTEDMIVECDATTEDDDFEAFRSILEIEKTRPSLYDHTYHMVKVVHEEVTPKLTPTQPEKKCFLCEVCGKMFETRIPFTNHLYKHTGIAAQQAKVCEICGKVCVNSAYFSKHLNSHNERNLECKECGKKFKTKRMVREHTQYKHFRETLKPCSICGERVSSSNFKQHRINCSSTGEYPCTKCDKKFAYASCLRQHMKCHFKNFKCETCGAVTNRLKVFEKHVCDDDLICKICQEIFLQETHLKRHMISNHSSTLRERGSSSSSEEEDESMDT